MLKVIQSGLEQQPWPIVNDLTVNPVPVDSLYAETFAGNLNLYLTASKPYAGALAHCPQKLPLFGGAFLTPYVSFDLEFMLTDEAAALCRCVEIDFKASMVDAKGQTIANIVDGSSQIELFRGGAIQIDNASSWTDTGSAVGTLPANVWIPWSGRFFIDVPNKQYSVQSIAVNGQTYAIPTALQRLAWKQSNWGQAVEPALQLDTTNPAAFTVKYRKIALTWSDQAF